MHNHATTIQRNLSCLFLQSNSTELTFTGNVSMAQFSLFCNAQEVPKDKLGNPNSWHQISSYPLPDSFPPTSEVNSNTAMWRFPALQMWVNVNLLTCISSEFLKHGYSTQIICCNFCIEFYILDIMQLGLVCFSLPAGLHNPLTHEYSKPTMPGATLHRPKLTAVCFSS